MLTAAVSTLGHSWTASNTLPASKLGVGSGQIASYAPTGIDYTLDASDPSTIASVSFTLSRQPGPSTQIKVRLDGSASTWYSCTATGSPAVIVTCNTPGFPAESGSGTIVAAD